MKISLIFISTLLVLSVFLPFFLFIYNGTKNTVSIKKQANALVKNNGLLYSLKEVWRKNFIGISTKNNTLTYIKFNSDKSHVINDVNLNEVKQCNILKNYNNGSNKSLFLKSLDLEFVYKSSAKPNLILNFFNIDDDLSEDFELQRIEKWHTLIKSAISEPLIVKMAS
ncbi:hypothetical protein QLS71_006135 [Mariniflexile litorale]|uniref:Uncharacterized protein n=1 Tax=Mariniflexile litorale TaxID=3045158 RepID=A0AAU7EHM7_9FLAO|nr:hypothetical protein [Mariniflexile sp. KMM 9835]MDQ8211157.1 hypothetical protein [Mariniflexile sp. KMM 9835]